MPAQEWSRGQAHGFRKVQIVEELTACAGAFYNLYLVDVNVYPRNVRGTARSFYHEATPGLESKSLLDGVLLCIGHTFIPSPFENLGAISFQVPAFPVFAWAWAWALFVSFFLVSAIYKGQPADGAQCPADPTPGPSVAVFLRPLALLFPRSSPDGPFRRNYLS